MHPTDTEGSTLGAQSDGMAASRRRLLAVYLPSLATDRLRQGQSASSDIPPSSGQALITMRAVNGHQQVAAVDADAAAYGLQPGMPLADARAMVPDLRCVPADPAGDAAALDGLAAQCERYTPWVALARHSGIGPLAVEPTRSTRIGPADQSSYQVADQTGDQPGGAAGLNLDITGCAHLLGSEARLLDRLLQRFAKLGFTAYGAIADTLGAAWAMLLAGGGRGAGGG